MEKLPDPWKFGLGRVCSVQLITQLELIFDSFPSNYRAKMIRSISYVGAPPSASNSSRIKLGFGGPQKSSRQYPNGDLSCQRLFYDTDTLSSFLPFWLGPCVEKTTPDQEFMWVCLAPPPTRLPINQGVGSSQKTLPRHPWRLGLAWPILVYATRALVVFFLSFWLALQKL
jgi:hypothetical protein